MPKGIYEPIGVGSGSGSSGGGGTAGQTTLTADTVRTVNSSTGNDVAGPGPYKTMQFAYDYLSTTYNGGGHSLTVNFQGAGPYTMDAETGWLNFSFVAFIGAGSGTTEFSNISFGWNNVFNLGSTFYLDSCHFSDTGINPQTATLNCCVWTEAGGVISLGGINNDVKVGPAAESCLKTTGADSQLQLFGTVTFTAGSSPYGIYVGYFSSAGSAAAVVFSGTPTFEAFLFITEGSLWNTYIGANSYTGSFTGRPFILVSGGVCAGDLTTAITSGSVPGNIIDSNMTDRFSWSVATPTTGSTVSMTLLQPTLLLKPAGTLATLTVHLPPIPIIGDLFSSVVRTATAVISSTQIITALTLNSTDGSTLLDAPTTISAGTGFSMFYDATSNTWYPEIISGASAASSLVNNSTTISGGSAAQFLYDNGGTLEETTLLTYNPTYGSAVILTYSGQTGMSLSGYYPTLALNMYNNGSAWFAIGNGYTALWNQTPTTGVMSFAILNTNATAGQNLGFYVTSALLTIAPSGAVATKNNTLDDGSGNMTLTGALELGNAYVNTPIVPTGYITLKDSTGTTYKVAVSL